MRCRALLASILERDPGFRGLMTFTLPESLWLHGHGFDDLLLAYPTADRGALAELARLEAERPPILMVDSVEQLDFIEAATGTSGPPVRVCIDVDLSWWPLGGRLKIGVKRSPVRTPDQARALAAEIARRPRFELAALMGYEAHIAGVVDRPLGKRIQEPVIRAIKSLSAAEIAERRAAVVAAVREVAEVAHRERRRDREHPHDARGRGDHRDHRRLRLLRANPLRPLLLVQPHSGCDVRDARGAASERRSGDFAGRGLPRLRGGGTRSAARHPTCHPACGSTRWRAPARCRRH